MKKLVICLLCALISILLTGCWDQNLLKDVKLAMAIGFDLAEDGRILQTVTIPQFKTATGGSEVNRSQVVSTIGDTPRNNRNLMNHKVAEQLDASKVQVVLMGEAYAKQDILPGLDVFYRDPRGSLLSELAVVKGRASDVLQLKIQENRIMSEYLSDLLRSEQEATVTPLQTRPVISDMLDPGADFVVPLIEAKEKEAAFIGLAMFNGNRYSGQYLPVEDSTLYLLMADQKQKKAWIKLQLSDDKQPRMKNFSTINVLKVKRNIHIKTEGEQPVSVDLNLQMKIEIMEFMEISPITDQILTDLNKKISELLTVQANSIIQRMQKANSDALGVGRYVRAYHPDVWKKINWSEEYAHIPYKAAVSVKITKHGVFR